jgi:hypothetical protein
MKIAAGIVVYADAEGLNRCLSTLGFDKGGFDGAIVVHVRFEHFEMIDPHSLEDTQRVASKYPNVYVYEVKEPITQVDARSLYMEKAGELGYDYLMVIDSDEYVLPNANWTKFREQLDYALSLDGPYQIFDVEFKGSAIYHGPLPRIFRDPGTIRYIQRHWWFLLTKTGVVLKGMSDTVRIIDGINIYHSKLVRSVGHMRATALYNSWQEIIESPAADPETQAKALKQLQEQQDAEILLTKEQSNI